MQLLLLKEQCTQCGKCITICHKGPCIFDINKKEIRDTSYCNACRLCITVCPADALHIT